MSSDTGPATLIVNGEEHHVIATISSAPPTESALGQWRGSLEGRDIVGVTVDHPEADIRVRERTGRVIISRLDLAASDRVQFVGSGPSPIDA